MKSYKNGDIVIVRKKIPKWSFGWTEVMDDYIGKESVVLHHDKESVFLLLKTSYDKFIKDGISLSLSYTYAFPIESIDNRKEKIERLLKLK